MVVRRSPEETYWEFFRADRAKDASAWAAVMSYPHVRVAAPGRIEYFRTEEEFVASADWTQRETTGWVRTEGIDPKVFQSGSDKVHLAGGWVRYNAEDEPILSNRVVYVLTRVRGGWGVQARFACGANQTWQNAADEKPANEVKRFLQRLREGDVEACARSIRYPFIVVGRGTVKQFVSETSFLDSLQQLSLGSGDINDITSIQNGQRGANVAVSLTAGDDQLNQAVFLIIRNDEDHRLAAISIVSA